MSWPHALSASRAIAGPVIAALILEWPGGGYLVAAVLFALASFTDLIDGKLARHADSATPFGVFLDTTSDKVMVSLVLVAMAIAGLAPAWIVLVVVGREFLISGLRSYAASRNRIVSAHLWGKGKTAVTMVAIFVVLIAAWGGAGAVRGAAHDSWPALSTGGTWLLGIAAALTVISGARYVVDALPLLRGDEGVPEVPARPPAA